MSEEAFRRLAESITRTIQTKVQQDLIYQDRCQSSRPHIRTPLQPAVFGGTWRGS